MDPDGRKSDGWSYRSKLSILYGIKADTNHLSGGNICQKCLHKIFDEPKMNPKNHYDQPVKDL